MRIRSILLALALSGCCRRSAARPPYARSPAPARSIAQNRFVRDVLFESCYWNQELPQSSPVFFPSPEAYLEAVRYRPLDVSYSYIANRAEQEAFFSDSQFVGLGISTQFNGTEMRLSQVFPDSPASEVGLPRGRAHPADQRPDHRRSQREQPAGDGVRRQHGPACSVALVWQHADRRGEVGDAGQARRDDPDGVGAAALRSRRPQGRLPELPQLRRSRRLARSRPRSRSCTRPARPSWCSTCATTAAGWSPSRSASPA